MFQDISLLDRLAHAGNHGLGALVHEPDRGTDMSEYELNPDRFADPTQRILESRGEDVLQQVLALNGPSAGARPKARTGVNLSRQNVNHGVVDPPDEYDHWLGKFTNTQYGIVSGAMEYIHALMAKQV